MTKDEALDLALEALEYASTGNRRPEIIGSAITAIKQARALDKKAENARELGLDYEPADGTQVSKVWWDGEKLMAKPIPLEDFYQPAPVQEPVAWRWKNNGEDKWLNEYVYLDNGGPDCPEECEPLYTTPPAAQRQWVGLTDEQIDQGLCRTPYAMKTAEAWREGVRWAYHQLKEKNT